MNSVVARRFWRLYAQLPAAVQAAARVAYQQFRANPHHPSLHFHRLVCDTRFWSVRVTHNYRAVGLVDGNMIIWFWIGPHAEFDVLFPR